MQVPLQLAFRGLEHDERIKNLVYEEMAKLEKVCDHIISSRVVIERTHQKKGNPYEVALVIEIPRSRQIVIRKAARKNNVHEPLPVVINDTFLTAQRTLKELVRQRRYEFQHPPQRIQVEAVVSKLFKDEGYGFLKDLYGREIYFNRNSVLENDFNNLKAGSGVRFSEEVGEKGLQASSVRMVTKTSV